MDVPSDFLVSLACARGARANEVSKRDLVRYCRDDFLQTYAGHRWSSDQLRGLYSLLLVLALCNTVISSFRSAIREWKRAEAYTENMALNERTVECHTWE